jgi:hypothetical protein
MSTEYGLAENRNKGNWKLSSNNVNWCKKLYFMEVCIFVEENSIIFIGKQSSRKEMKIYSKPSFYDAVQLSTQSPRTHEDNSYLSIPFNRKMIPVHILNSKIQLTYEEHSLQIYHENNNLNEKEVIEILTHVAVKEGNKVSFLAVFPNDKTKLTKVKTTRTLTESKKMKEGSEV